MRHVTRTAWAKINLALHITGQRDDGYHLLQSLVTFAASGDRCGDRLHLADSETDRLTISGRFSQGLPDDNDPSSGNLVLRARDILRIYLKSQGVAAPPVHIHLEKNLPVASGIGGGSADAAAVFSGLNELWNAGVSLPALKILGLRLGADLPMCLTGKPLYAGGIGEEIDLLPGFPPLALVLVNPLVEVSTPAIFRGLATKVNPTMHVPTGRQDKDGWLQALSGMRNDLEPPARAEAPEIGLVSSSLAEEGARLVRMSGSGATCFGIFDTLDDADEAAARLEMRHPGWYVAATQTVGGCDA